jgi:DNA-binding MarR family transcriptional regulator
MRELARRLDCDPSNITLLVDQLEAVGLVRRQPDPTDGRRRVLTLTDSGLALWSRLLERMQQRSALFTLTIEEQNQLLGLLQKVETNRAQIPTGFLT